MHLSIAEGHDSRVLLHCFHGCTVEKIISALNLEFKDLFAGSGGHRSSGHTFRREPTPRIAIAPPLAEEPAARDWSSLAESLGRYAIANGQLDKLARSLGVSSSVLQSLGVGFDPSKKAWVIPERNDQGNVVGLGRRFQDNRKSFWTGSKRGLAYLPNVAINGGTVFIVEGMSDVAALETMGLAAYGRPSNTGGVKYLAPLLGNDPRKVLVVAEWDDKENGQFPGRDGAIKVSRELAERLGKPIFWAFPPPGHKDSRKWLNDRAPDLLGQADPGRPSLEELGREYASLLTATATEVVPQVVAVERKRREKEAAEQAIRDRATFWIGGLQEHKGISLDSKACPSERIPGLCRDTILGSGLGKTLSIVESQKACKNLRDCFEKHNATPDAKDNIIGAIYPSRRPFRPLEERRRRDAEDDEDEGSCENYGEVLQAHKLGLPVQSAVCKPCSHFDACKFQRQLADAKRAPHAIMTAQRAEFTNLSADTADRDGVMMFTGRSLDIVVPRLTHRFGLEEGKTSLNRIWAAAKQAGSKLVQESKELSRFFRHLAEIADTIKTGIESGKPGPITLPRRLETPMRWAEILYEIFTRQGWIPIAKLARACTAAAAGKLANLVVQIDELGGYVVATWRAQRINSPTLVVDPTVNAAELSSASGRVVHAVDSVAPSRNAVQVLEQTTGQKRPSTIVAQLAGFLATNPAGRIGAIMTTEQRKGVTEESCHLETDRFEIISWTDSVSRLDGCCLVAIFGHPPCPPEEVCKYLTQIEKREAAEGQGDWGEITWVGSGLDGKLVKVVTKGYRHPEWRGAYENIIRGRVGQILVDCPAPAWVFSAEDLGLPLAKAPAPLDEKDLRIIEALGGSGATARFAINKTQNLIANLAVAPLNVTTSDLFDRLALPEKTIRNRLVELRKAGYVRKIGERGGWQLTDLIGSGVAQSEEAGEDELPAALFDIRWDTP
jgi:hypothetical protein